MDLIRTEAELADNIGRLKEYLRKPGQDRDFAVALIRQGICFVVTEEGSRAFFTPSRFVGYRANTRHLHSQNQDKDGRETNRALHALLGERPTPNASIEEEYEEFCDFLGVRVRKPSFGTSRKFWDKR